MTISYRLYQNRLAQFKQWRNDPHAWEEKWSHTNDLTRFLNAYADGRLDEFEIFTRYLPKDEPVLEAGCGKGQLVMSLAARGYQIEGVDYDAITVKRIQEVAPHLNVRVGDVYDLKVPDGYYGGYISMGVFEHNPDGPLEGLKEVSRVLASDGVAFITVPYLNPARRRWLNSLPAAHGRKLFNNLDFYQYYFSVPEFTAFLEQAGLSVIEYYPYAVYAGVTRDFAFGRWLDRHGFFMWRIQKLFSQRCLRASKCARWRWAHMMMYVCHPFRQ